MSVTPLDPPVPELPELPDLEELKANAYQRRDHFVAIRNRATEEIEKSEAIISALGGKSSATVEKERNASPETYRMVVSALAERDYASISTLSSDAHVSRGHVGIVMRIAEERGHAERTNPLAKRRFRWRLTQSGMEFLTRPTLLANGNGAAAH